MGKRAWTIVLAVAAATFGVGAWLQLRPAPAPQAPVAKQAGPIPTRAQLAGLQAQADNACQCGRRLNDPWNEGCWREFQGNLARFEHSGMASACGEESTSVECFGAEGPNQLCVSTGRLYGACSDAEERTLLARAQARSGCH